VLPTSCGSFDLANETLRRLEVSISAMPRTLTGIIPACHTPFTSDGQLDLATVDRQAAYFQNAGLRAVFVAGTTGECASLTIDERKALCDRWAQAAGDSLQIAVNVGHNCLADAVALAEHARQAGVAAIAAMAPSYHKPETIEDLIEFCIPIAAEAEPLPFYYYHIPSMTGVDLPASEFLHKARFRMPNLRGLKFSHDDLLQLQFCVGLDRGAFDVLFGVDEALLAGLALGVRGAIGGTYNFASAHFQRLIKAFEVGDIALARAMQQKSAELVRILAKHGFIASSKAVMALAGVPCGPVRPPLHNLSSEEAAAVTDQIDALGVLG
jgi:N-acetylneuraminate lyase